MTAEQFTDLARTTDLPGGPERRAYSIEEVARRWGMLHMGIYRMIKRGDLPAFRVGRLGEYRIRRDVVEAIERGETPSREV